MPAEVGLEYLPTQYLCEFIKNQGFSGIAYKSAIDQSHNSGFNIVFFDDSNLTISETTQYTISSTQVEVRQIN
ncbi:MAG: RES family NAD+ phosphorylase [Victivallaceae bacterium]|nr:RES family NAD+ phosphorylase [Victivallaceae bacterium]